MCEEVIDLWKQFEGIDRYGFVNGSDGLWERDPSWGTSLEQRLVVLLKH